MRRAAGTSGRSVASGRALAQSTTSSSMWSSSPTISALCARNERLEPSR